MAVVDFSTLSVKDLTSADFAKLVGLYYVEKAEDAGGVVPASDASAQFITRAQLPELTRVIRPGDFVTQELNPNRLKVYLDAASKITRALPG
jgi:hypothetical protein